MLRALLLVVASVLHLQANTCQANFLFGFVDASTVVFYNQSENHLIASWEYSTDDYTLVNEHGDARTVTFHAFPVDVCLIVTGNNNCSDILCLQIYPGSPQDMCMTDCIWPGDTNGDGKANVYDLLNIGLGFNESGPAREDFPSSNPNTWAPAHGEDWAQDLGGVNYKHFDCNGSGEVNEADITAIEENYNPGFDPLPDTLDGGLPIYLEFEDSIVFIDPNDPEPVVVTANLFLGTFQQPAQNLHGFALALNYPFDYVQASTAEVDYRESSFFGNLNEVVSVKQDLYLSNLGRYDLAYSRKNADGAEGYGIVAEVSFIVEADIIDGKGSAGDQKVPFELSLDKLLLLDADGLPINCQLPDTAAYVTLHIQDQLASTSNEQDVLNRKLTLAPNPAYGRTFLRWEVTGEVLIRIVDASGRALLQHPTAGQTAELNTSAWAPGVYIVQVESREGRMVKKLLVR
jgi:hypothetical protein